jgi:hypothetical protein
MLCECGCGNITKLNKKQQHNRYIVGHSTKNKKRTDEQRKKYKDSWTPKRREEKRQRWLNNNPMKNEDVVAKFLGENNPAKRLDVRKKIYDNNSMKDSINIQKIIDSDGWKQNNLISIDRWARNNPAKNKKLLEKRIDTYTKRLAEGKYSIKNNWKTGWFSKNDGNKEWFDSSLEENRMNFYESINVVWTKKHGIRIPYINNELHTYYIPDFLVDNKFLDEVKGWIKPIDKIKATVAKEYCKQHNLIYRFYLGTKLISELSSD